MKDPEEENDEIETKDDPSGLERVGVWQESQDDPQDEHKYRQQVNDVPCVCDVTLETSTDCLRSWGHELKNTGWSDYKTVTVAIFCELNVVRAWLL